MNMQIEKYERVVRYDVVVTDSTVSYPGINQLSKLPRK